MKKLKAKRINGAYYIDGVKVRERNLSKWFDRLPPQWKPLKDKIRLLGGGVRYEKDGGFWIYFIPYKKRGRRDDV